MRLRLALSSAAILAAIACLPLCGASPPSVEYFVKLVCESADRILTVRFDGQKAEIIKETETRMLASDISGPHGIAFSPDRKTFFISIGHGRPYGSAVR